jgi:hypothetical protein
VYPVFANQSYRQLANVIAGARRLLLEEDTVAIASITVQREVSNAASLDYVSRAWTAHLWSSYLVVP